MKEKSLYTFLLFILIIAGLTRVNVGSCSDAEWTKIHVAPSMNVYDPGQRFNVTIYVENVTSLRSWGARLYFDTTMLYTSLDASRIWEGTFLPKPTDFPPRTTFFTKKVVPGYVSVTSTLTSPSAPYGVSGSGSLAIVEFQVVGTGKCNLDLADTSLLDGYNNPIPHTFIDGSFQTHYPRAEFTYSPSPKTAPYYRDPVVGEVITFNASTSYDPDGYIVNYSWDFGDGNTTDVSGPIIYHEYTEPETYSVNLTVTDNATLKDWYAIETVKVLLHDIAITDITVFPPEAKPGDSVYINVTVANQGKVYENFNVSVYYDNNPIPYSTEGKMNTTTNLPNGNSAIISFIWNTTGLAEGNYTIRANASLVSNRPPYEFLTGLEQNVTNNMYIDGNVTVTSTPSHDIAVIDIKANPTAVEPRGVTSIDVKVQNQRNWDENFNGTLYSNSTLLKTWTNIEIKPYQTTILSFAWNTTGIPKGAYTLSANVTKLLNETDTADNTLTDGSVNISLPPQPSFAYYPSIPLVGQTVTFNASASLDPDGSIVSYKWNFGDGTFPTTVTNPIITHVYSSSKTYQVNLTVTDNAGLSVTQSKSLKIVTAYPVAAFTYSPSSPIAGAATTFNASSSKPDGGSLVSYAWNFGDENKTTVTTPTTVHIYDSHGTYNVVLNVTDSEGMSSIETQSITVRAYPVAAFTYSPQSPKAGETITFDASSSLPQGGTIVSYLWNFGDGNTTTVTTPVISHAYAAPGSFSVKLNVTDSEGLTNILTKTITVETAPFGVNIVLLAAAGIAIIIIAAVIIYLVKFRKPS